MVKKSSGQKVVKWGRLDKGPFLANISLRSKSSRTPAKYENPKEQIIPFIK
ncbi:MAG: hypothetical protein ACI883_000990 [Candidatus Azotimanducaceae bacterium]|jgi:hypothetical protein